MTATNGHATLTNTADHLDVTTAGMPAGGLEGSSTPIGDAAAAAAPQHAGPLEGAGALAAAVALGALGVPARPVEAGAGLVRSSSGGWAVPPPPPAVAPEVPVPIAEGPAGALADLPYRWTARVMILDRPDLAARPHVFRLEGPTIPHDRFPMSLMTTERGTDRLVQIGTVTSIYPATGQDGAREICAAGLFDLHVPYVPAFVRELVNAAERGAPMVAVPRLVSQQCHEVGGALEMSGWCIAGLVIGPAATWPGCFIVPDEAHVRVEVGGQLYAMRRHHDPRVWRTLCKAWASCHPVPGVGAWDRLNAALAIVQAAADTATLEAIARRLSANSSAPDALTPLALMACIDRLVRDLDADDARRGGSR